MDTRGKIVASAAELPRDATVVSGYFDPMLAWHAQRLQHIKQDKPLIVIIENPTDPILPARARAELVASLRVVDYVIECPEGIAIDHRLESDDLANFARLQRHVHGRQQGAS